MAGKLQNEIGKKSPFASLEEEFSLNLLRTADRMTGYFETAMKAAALTPTQYNVLRILRGVSPQGVACQEIARMMITRDADLTRLLDRLETRDLLRRERQTADRRVIHILITPAGVALLSDLDPVVERMNKTLLGCFGSERLSPLIDLLEHIRDRIEKGSPPLIQ